MSAVGIIAAIGAAVVLNKRKTNAVGRLPKRRIYTEIADAQAAGIVLWDGYSPEYNTKFYEKGKLQTIYTVW